jgi:hypothetical protein
MCVYVCVCTHMYVRIYIQAPAIEASAAEALTSRRVPYLMRAYLVRRQPLQGKKNLKKKKKRKQARHVRSESQRVIQRASTDIQRRKKNKKRICKRALRGGTSTHLPPPPPEMEEEKKSYEKAPEKTATKNEKKVLRERELRPHTLVA